MKIEAARTVLHKNPGWFKISAIKDNAAFIFGIIDRLSASPAPDAVRELYAVIAEMLAEEDKGPISTATIARAQRALSLRTAPPIPESPWKGMEDADPKETILMEYQGGYIGSGKKDTGIRNGALRWMPLPSTPERGKEA